MNRSIQSDKSQLINWRRKFDPQLPILHSWITPIFWSGQRYTKRSCTLIQKNDRTGVLSAVNRRARLGKATSSTLRARAQGHGERKVTASASARSCYRRSNRTVLSADIEGLHGPRSWSRAVLRRARHSHESIGSRFRDGL